MVPLVINPIYTLLYIVGFYWLYHISLFQVDLGFDHGSRIVRIVDASYQHFLYDSFSCCRKTAAGSINQMFVLQNCHRKTSGSSSNSPTTSQPPFLTISQTSPSHKKSLKSWACASNRLASPKALLKHSWAPPAQPQLWTVMVTPHPVEKGRIIFIEWQGAQINRKDLVENLP